MTKSFGIFFDGTCNNKSDKEDLRTNVARLSEIYTEDKLYVRGVGSEIRDGDESFGEVGFIRSVTGAAFGAGGQLRVDFALDKLKEFAGTLPADAQVNVDVFGFSRGAALARHFVNKAYGTDKVLIRFLGIFDTVGSFGIPGNSVDAGYNLSIDKSKVKYTYHITADDELRENFDLTSIKSSDSDKLAANDDNWMVEETCPGAHADIGGGYDGKEFEHNNDNNKLSLVYLEMMHAKAVSVQVPFGDIPDSLKSPTELADSFQKLMELYKTNNDLYPVHKTLRDFESSLDIFKDRIKKCRVPANTPRGNASVRRDKQLKKKNLKKALSYAEAKTQELKMNIEGMLGIEYHSFTDFYLEFRKNYIHSSHSPFNKTAGMNAQTKNISIADDSVAIVQRDIFYL